MIYSRLMAESAVDDAIQTPDDIGVDLDQVEKDIAGENGIAAHQDEVEDAQEGMIGEPVEEFAMIIYESEYNYNQIMESIGMAELREASMGRELIYEAVDIKGFFEKVKKWLVSMFEKLTQAVRKLLAKLDFQAKADKKFVEKNKLQIKAGEKARDWAFEGYDFKEELSLARKSMTNDYRTEVQKGLDDAKNGKASQDDLRKLDMALAETAVHGKAYGIFGITADSMEDFKAKLKEKLFGKTKVSLKGKVSADDVIKVLSEDRETRRIRDEYENIKKGYKNTLAVIKDWEKKVSGNDAHIGACMHICQLGTRAVKIEQNTMHAAYGIYIQAAKAKRAQYRKLAHHWADAYKEGKTPKNETASLFDSVSML